MAAPFRRDCSQHCCRAAGQPPTHVGNAGISAQPATGDRRSWPTCPLLRIRGAAALHAARRLTARAVRAYFVEEMAASEVADRFGYSPASVHQMATVLRAGRMSLFADARPGPKGPREATGQLRLRVLALRAAGHSVTEIAAALTAEGLPVSAQTTWQILAAEGIGRLPRRESNHTLLAGLVAALRPLGLATGEAGFNCDFHAIRHHGDDAVLEKHYVPRRSQRTRAVLTFFAQDHASSEMVYANADITKAGQAREIIAFADYWPHATARHPGTLVFDSQLTTYKILDELTGRGITWLTLRQRGKAELARLAALPASAWKSATITRTGRYRRPRLHEDMVKLTGVSSRVRQIAVKNTGRDEPTLLTTHDLATPARELFARYAERMIVENELDAYIGGFHIDALTSGVPLNVDLDTTLTVVAGNLYRLLALKLDRYQNATPDKIWRHFLDATGTLHITGTGVTCALNLRSHHPVLIDAGFADLEIPIPWWDGRTLRFRFPPR